MAQGITVTVTGRGGDHCLSLARTTKGAAIGAIF